MILPDIVPHLNPIHCEEALVKGKGPGFRYLTNDEGSEELREIGAAWSMTFLLVLFRLAAKGYNPLCHAQLTCCVWTRFNDGGVRKARRGPLPVQLAITAR